MQINFGLGVLALIPSGVNPSPVQFGVLQDINLDISYTSKSLRGAKNFAYDTARAGGKITGKAKVGSITGALYLNLISGAAMTTGSKIIVPSESGTIPVTPFTITVANGATFDRDLGVIDNTTGLAMTCVAATPATGQYSVTAAGEYTFAAADTGHQVIFTYSYTAAAIGKTITISNTLMGAAPTFLAVFGNSYRSKYHGAKIFACTSNKLGIGMKAEDYTTWDIDLEGVDDGTGKVFELYTSE